MLIGPVCGKEIKAAKYEVAMVKDEEEDKKIESAELMSY